ncbi:MAG: ubiquinol-cytochrome c reductase iron-sulfur subunit [Rhodospirillaceae bacterium]|nr:ubiquinol-cytochrome c reductase iron-sulfur subunit [Rhodospirillaceae bacterium]
MADSTPEGDQTSVTEEEGTRRDFLVLAAGAMGAMGAVGVVWPLIETMNPSADVLALASTEVDISGISEGQAISVMWRGKPVFIRHRTQAEIEEAQKVNIDDLSDPEADEDRSYKGKWLILVGVCTHLGCIPLGNKLGDPKGEYGGWFCPCHGSHYDTSGRIRKGPAPRNLEVPEHNFLDDTLVKIG